MTSVSKTKKQLLEDIAELRRRNDALEATLAEADRVRVELGEFEMRYRTLFELAPVAIGVGTLDGRVLAVNSAMLRLTGYTLDEFRAINIADRYVDPAQRTLWVEELRQHGRVRDREVMMKHKDGTAYNALLNIDVMSEQGVVINAVQDITELRRAEEALRQSEERYRTIFESSRDAIYITTREGKFIDVNQATADITGYTRDELLSINVQRLYADPADRPRFQYEIEQREYIRDYEVQFRRKDGAVIDCLLNSTVWRDAAGRIAGYQGVITDITERKRADDKLRQTMEELARSNAELERFAYVASHDLQEPLRMVSSYVQLLARRYKGRLDADADDFIAFAVDGSNRMQELIEDLLAYSRVSTRGGELAPTPVDAALNRALFNLQTATEESGAVVASGPLPTVMADAMQLAQVFQNLVSNAIKFHGEAPPRVHVSAERNGNEWVFAVHDNGIGIAPEYSDRIFVIFQRLHGSKYAGTGIGLAICKRIVERHGGRIWVESQPDEGATFFFTIPVRKGV